MHTVNLLLYRFVFTLAGQHIMIQCGVCESDLVLVGHSAESVRRCFLGQSLWDSKHFTDLDNFMYEQISERAEVSGSIAVFGRISDIIFGTVTGIYHTSSIWQCLSDCVECAHSETWRHIDHGISRKFIRMNGVTFCKCFVYCT